jgi:hypothetical protein
MTSLKPLTASEGYARFILSAWNKRGFTEMESALTQPSSALSAALPAEEWERMDLICDLGRNLLVWDRSGDVKNATDKGAALALLRHLARRE